MLTVQHIEEALSRAYVAAVAGRAGLNSSSWNFDYGVDCSVHEIVIINGKRHNSGITLDFQLKATKSFALDAKHVIYDVEVDTYNHIVSRHNASTSGANPCILALLCLPSDPSVWLELTEEHLVLRHCCYWTYLTGEPTKNKRTLRIRIPRGQLLTPESMQNLLAQVKQGCLR